MTIKHIQRTVRPVGVDGSALATTTVNVNHAGIIRAIGIDYQNQPATTDILIKAESTTGATLFTRSNSNTDLALTPVAMPGIDEGGAATAATDVGSGGWPFKRNIFIDVAQGDGQTSGNEAIVFDFIVEV